MLKKITNTTATYGLGLPTSGKLFRVESDNYDGRMIMIIHTSGNTIKYSYADKPYTIWSTPTTIATDAADYSSDAVMDTDGNVHIMYTDSNDYLVARKLTFTEGSWSVGNAVTVYNTNPSYWPSLVIESSGKLWVGWTRSISGTETLCVKSSTDSGATWGSGTSDAGDVLTSGSTALFSKLMIATNDIHAIYTDGGTELSIRTRPLSSGNWSDEYNIATGSGFDSNFDVALSSGGMLAVVYDDGELHYRQYNGSNWDAIEDLDFQEGLLPQIFFINNVPYVIYVIYDAPDQYLFKQTNRKSGSFSTSEPFDDSSKTFDAVLLYNATAATHVDCTSAAASSTTADIYHPSSNALVDEYGDYLLIGLNRKFRFVYFNLFTAGSGGSVVYSYWDGSNWKAFTPSSGAYHLNTGEKRLVLWDDYLSMPDDWQKTTVDGVEKFWVRIGVGSIFTTAPVGSRITAISDIHEFIMRR